MKTSGNVLPERKCNDNRLACKLYGSAFSIARGSTVEFTWREQIAAELLLILVGLTTHEG
jgi:hypothetical protein